MPLPNFMIIGVAKAGTTSLYHYLDQHSEIYVPHVKAPNFFGYEDARAWSFNDEGKAPLLQNFPVRTFDEYEALFAGVKDEIAIGEASPQYFRCPNAARRIHECIPDVKLIASLRNPADRAFSGFLMRTRRGETVKSSYEELTAEASHVKEGFYYKRLKRYFDLFQKDQIRICIFETFKQDSAKTVIELFSFLGVDSNFVVDTSVKHNPAGIPKIKLINRFFFNPKLIRAAKSLLSRRMQETAKRIQKKNLKPPPVFPSDLRADLLDLYREDIHKLEDLLDRDLSIWLQGV